MLVPVAAIRSVQFSISLCVLEEKLSLERWGGLLSFSCAFQYLPPAFFLRCDSLVCPACSRNKQHLQWCQATAAAAKAHPHDKSWVKYQLCLILPLRLVSTQNPLLAHINEACLPWLSCIYFNRCTLSMTDEWDCNMTTWPSFAIWGPDILAHHSLAP